MSVLTMCVARALVAEDALANVTGGASPSSAPFCAADYNFKCMTRAPFIWICFILWQVRHACKAGLSLAPEAPENMKALHAPGSLPAIICGNLQEKKKMRSGLRRQSTSKTQTKGRKHTHCDPPPTLEKKTKRGRYAPQVQYAMTGQAEDTAGKPQTRKLTRLSRSGRHKRWRSRLQH